MEQGIHKVDISAELQVIVLFLQKLEQLNQHERSVLIKTIEWLNNPVFITNEPINQ